MSDLLFRCAGFDIYNKLFEKMYNLKIYISRQSARDSKPAWHSPDRNPNAETGEFGAGFPVRDREVACSASDLNGFKFRILYLEGSVISLFSPFSEGFPGPF